MAAVANDSTPNLSWKSAQARETCPLTKIYLDHAAKIAIKIQENHKTFLDRFRSLSQGQKEAAVIGGALSGALYAMGAIVTLESSSPYFVGISTAAAFQHALGAHSARIFCATENRKLLEAKLPVVKEELNQSTLSLATKEKVAAIFDKTISLLRIIEARETSLAAGKGFTALTALAWMAGSAFGIPLLPTLSILVGSGSLMLASREDGFMREISPSTIAKEIQEEIVRLA